MIGNLCPGIFQSLEFPAGGPPRAVRYGLIVIVECTSKMSLLHLSM
jgi:hypothetical protein